LEYLQAGSAGAVTNCSFRISALARARALWGLTTPSFGRWRAKSFRTAAQVRASWGLIDRNEFSARRLASVARLGSRRATAVATYADPHQFPTGARTSVIVSGTLAVEDANHTGALPGTVLKRDRAGAVG
jgi:hypothetical protein